MQRQSLALPDEEIVAEFGRVVNLFARAFPRPGDLALFCRLMNEASAQGYTWVEALEQTVDLRFP